MDVFAQIETRVAAALEALKAEGALDADVPTAGIEVETPRDPTHGDLSTNAAMVLAKPARMKPRDIADKLQAKLSGDPEVVGAVSSPGPASSISRSSPRCWHGLVRAILEQGADYGRSAIGKGKNGQRRVRVCKSNGADARRPLPRRRVRRCACQSAGLRRFDVTREYYVNDAGGQVDVLARSVFLRYREALGEDIGEMPAGLYPGDYLKPVGEALAKEHGTSLLNMPEDGWLPIVRTFAIDQMMPIIKDDLAALNIRHDVFFSEASLTNGGTDKIKAAIEALRKQGPHLRGPAAAPQGPR